MPINFYSVSGSSHKKYKLTILFALSPLFFFAQSLTGLWVGALSNDSTTIRKDQSFEIALTEYKGKVYGYSRSEFIVDDVLYYIVKRVKGTIEGDVCEVMDDEIISYNFPRKLDKNVKVISTFRKDKNDNAWHLDGKWKTNATKKYYSVSGKVALEQEPDLTASKIFPHLEELKLADDIAFYKDRKEGQPIVKIVKPEKATLEYAAKAEKIVLENETASTTNNTIAQKAAPAIITAKPTFSNSKGETVVPKEASVVITEPGKAEPIVTKENISASVKTNTPVITNPVIEKKEIKTEPVVIAQKNIVSGQTDIASVKPDVKTNTTAPVKTEPIVKTVTKQDAPVTKPQQQITTKQPETKTVAATTIKPETKKPETISTTTINPTAVAVTSVIPEKKETIITPVINDIKKPALDVTLKAALIAGRKSEFSQVVNFKSDSLQIFLYDNGEIDGDTVSVYMNGEVLLASQGLKSSAIRKTIYLTGKEDEFTLVMFAESLGKYPPNTGLLVIRDGDDVYNLRFSSDFQKNAGIVFKRKK